MLRNQNHSFKFTIFFIFITMILAACTNNQASNPSNNNSQGDKDQKKEPIQLLNVSYDPTRELYDEFNKEFAKFWAEKTH